MVGRREDVALKGPAKKGALVPGMMGKNGDQIQRLFNSSADVFFVQYEGEIAESVVEQMEKLAKVRALFRRSDFVRNYRQAGYLPTAPRVSFRV